MTFAPTTPCACGRSTRLAASLQPCPRCGGGRIFLTLPCPHCGRCDAAFVAGNLLAGYEVDDLDLAAAIGARIDRRAE